MGDTIAWFTKASEQRQHDDSSSHFKGGCALRSTLYTQMIMAMA